LGDEALWVEEVQLVALEQAGAEGSSGTSPARWGHQEDLGSLVETSSQKKPHRSQCCKKMNPEKRYPHSLRRLKKMPPKVRTGH
jgi:hypothetical protein